MVNRLVSAAVLAAIAAPAVAQMQAMGPATMPPPAPGPAPEAPPPRPQPGVPVGQGAGWNGGNTGVPVGQGAGWNGGNNGVPVGQGAGWNGGNRPPPGWGGGARFVRCESWQFRYAQCRMDTRRGVEFAQIIAGDCRPGNWGWRPGLVWVNNGCRADFRPAGYGGDAGYDGGPSAGAVIGGVAIAAGLLALLAASKKTTPAAVTAAATGAPPARLNVDTGGVEPAARPSLDVCLHEAAREFGAAGGTVLTLDRFDSVTPGNGGFRFRFVLTGTDRDGTRPIPIACRATPTKLVELTFG